MKSNKIYIVAAICLLLGIALFIGGFASMGFSIRELSNEGEYIEKSYMTSEASFNSLVVEDKNFGVEISKSEDGFFHVDYAENDKYSYTIKENDGTLSVVKNFSGNWLSFLWSFNFTKHTLEIRVPDSFKGSVSIETDNGDIEIADIMCSDMNIKTSNGHVEVKKTYISGNAEVETDNGYIDLNDSEITGVLKADTDNGLITIDAVRSAKAIEAETSNGKITVKNLTAGAITATTNNGAVSLSDVRSESSITLETGNKSISLSAVDFDTVLNCKTDNGDITGYIKGSLGDFSYNCKTANGDCNLPTSQSGGSTGKEIKMKTSNGNINISFE